MENLAKFSPKTRVLFERLHLAETPKGFFTVLKELLQALEKDPRSKRGFKQLVEKMRQEDSDFQMQKELVVEWMKQKLELIRKLKCSKKKEVGAALEKLDFFLSGKTWEVRTGGYFHALTDYFQSACWVVARYGLHKVIEDFIKIYEKKHSYIFESDVFKGFPSGALDPYSKQGKTLSEHLGHGFICAEVLEKWDFEWDRDRTRIDLVCGEVSQIVYPEAYYFWSKNHDLTDSTVSLDYCGEGNLRFLLQLSLRSDLSPIPICSLPKPRTFFEGDSLCNQQLLQYFLSCFQDSSWKGAPLSKEAILIRLQRLITFLPLAQESVINKKSAHQSKAICREIYRAELQKNWDVFIKEGASPRDYNDFKPKIMQLKQAISSRPDVHIRLEDFSETLMEKVRRKFGREKGFIAKRGKSKKG